MRLIDGNRLAEKLHNIMACWNCSPCLNSQEAHIAVGHLRVALQEIENMPIINLEDLMKQRMDKEMELSEYSVVVHTTPNFHDNPDKPYFWFIMKNGGLANWGSGWAKTPIQAFKDGYDYCKGLT